MSGHFEDDRLADAEIADVIDDNVVETPEGREVDVQTGREDTGRLSVCSVDLLNNSELHTEWKNACEESLAKIHELFRVAKQPERTKGTIHNALLEANKKLVSVADKRVAYALSKYDSGLPRTVSADARYVNALMQIADMYEVSVDDIVDNVDQVTQAISTLNAVRSKLEQSDALLGIQRLFDKLQISKDREEAVEQKLFNAIEENGALKQKLRQLELDSDFQDLPADNRVDRRSNQREKKKTLTELEKGNSSNVDNVNVNDVQVSSDSTSAPAPTMDLAHQQEPRPRSRLQTDRSCSSESSATSLGVGETAMQTFVRNQVKLAQMQHMPKLKKFSGEGSKTLDDFVKSFDKRFPSEIFDDESRAEFFADHLEGLVLSHFNAFSKEVKGSFNRINYALSEKLKCAGTVAALAAFSKLDKLSYNGKTAADLDKFCVELDGLMRRAHPDLKEKELSLRKATILLRQYEKRPEELRDLSVRLEAAEKGQEYRTVRDVALSWARVSDRLSPPKTEEAQQQQPVRKNFGLGKFNNWNPSRPSAPVKSSTCTGSSEKAFDRSKSDRSQMACFFCHEFGHVAKMCPSKAGKSQKSTGSQEAGTSSGNGQRSRVGALSIRPVQVKSIKAIKPMVVPRFGERMEKPVNVLGKQYSALMDTGAQVTTMSTDILVDAERRGMDVLAAVKDVDPSQLKEDFKLVSYCNTELKFERVATVEVQLVENGARAIVPVYFDSRTSGEVLLGTNALKALGVKLVVDGMPSDKDEVTTEFRHVKEMTVREEVREELKVATIQKRVVVEPGSTKTVVVSAPSCSTDVSPVLWIPDEECRLSSGVHRVESGFVDVPVSNLTVSSMVFNCGDVLGTWDTECKVHEVDPCCLNELQLLDEDGTKGSLTSGIDRKRKLLEVLNEARKEKPVSELPDAIKSILLKFADVFALEDCELTQTDVVELDIDTGNAEPIRQKARRVPYGARNQLKAILDGLLEKGVIARSSSEWASPIVLVEKKDKSLRLGVDYRELNKVMKHDAYPLPVIDQILQSLSGKSFFSTLDLHSGFWQLPLSKSAQSKSAFTTCEGLFEFKVVTFGLSTSPAVFQRTMETVLKEVDGYGDEVIVYVDDVLIATADEERHAIVLEKVLECFKKAKLKLKAQKCKVMLNQVEYLGHVVNSSGIDTDPDKVESIKNFPTPTNVTELRRFLGLCNYYRKFVLRYGAIAKPLNELTGKKEWKWTESCDIAFAKLKDALSRAPVLGQPDITAASTGEKPFIIYTDASRLGVGAVLCQDGGDGYLHPIYFASKSLSKAQKNYSITDLEALAVVFACEKFHFFIFGMKVIVRSDHQPLLALFKRTDVSPRVMRWAIQLMAYSGLTMEYVKGKANVVADALSRGLAMIPGQEGVAETDDKVIANLSTRTESDWLKELKDDPDFAHLIVNVEKGNMDFRVKLPKVSKMVYARDFVLHDGALCFISSDGSLKRVVPKSKRKPLFLEQHNKGHFAAGKIAKILQKELYWNGLLTDVANWHKECVICYVNNVKPAIPPLKPILTAKPYDLVAIDLMDLGVTENGNRYVVTIIDHFSKFANAYPIRDKSARTVAECIVYLWMCQGGRWPKEFLSDQGSEFVNSVVEEIVSLTGCKWITTKGYNSRENGLVERVQRTLQNALKKCVDSPAKWDTVLPFVVYAYNTTCHESTGESPYFLLHGTDPPLISEIAPPRELTLALVDSDDYRAHLMESVRIAREFACERNAREADHMKKHYDDRRKASKEKLPQVGGRVFVYMPQEKMSSKNPKLVQEYRGPYLVLESSDTSALVTLINGNEEPIRIQHDFLLKVPECFEDVILETKTKCRNKVKRRNVKKVAVEQPEIRINCLKSLYSVGRTEASSSKAGLEGFQKERNVLHSRRRRSPLEKVDVQLRRLKCLRPNLQYAIGSDGISEEVKELAVRPEALVYPGSKTLQARGMRMRELGMPVLGTLYSDSWGPRSLGEGHVDGEHSVIMIDYFSDETAMSRSRTVASISEEDQGGSTFPRPAVNPRRTEV